MIRPALTREQAEALVMGLRLLRADCVVSNTRIAGAPLVDLRLAQKAIEAELAKPVERSGFEAMGVREWERQCWPPRSEP